MAPVATNEVDQVLSFLRLWGQREIEIGSGNGHFLVECAAKNLTRGFIGIERKQKRCGKIEKKRESRNLKNVIVFNGDAARLFEQLPLSSIDVFHLYFPDPWPKTKHRRRRLFKMPMLEQFYRALKTGGMLFFASDVFDYYIQARVLGIMHGGFETLDIAIPEEAVTSMFSKKTAALGKTIHKLVLQKATG